MDFNLGGINSICPNCKSAFLPVFISEEEDSGDKQTCIAWRCPCGKKVHTMKTDKK